MKISVCIKSVKSSAMREYSKWEIFTMARLAEKT